MRLNPAIRFNAANAYMSRSIDVDKIDLNKEPHEQVGGDMKPHFSIGGGCIGEPGQVKWSRGDGDFPVLAYNPNLAELETEMERYKRKNPAESIQQDWLRRGRAALIQTFSQSLKELPEAERQKFWLMLNSPELDGVCKQIPATGALSLFYTENYHFPAEGKSHFKSHIRFNQLG